MSAVLFHGYSVDNIYRLIEPLYYDDRTLADVVITAVAEKKENTKIQPKGVYYIATFSYKLADAGQTEAGQSICAAEPDFQAGDADRHRQRENVAELLQPVPKRRRRYVGPPRRTTGGRYAPADCPGG